MATIVATITQQFLDIQPELFSPAGSALGKVIDAFRVGEGGYEVTPSGNVPRTPDPNLTDLDAIENPSRYASDSVATFEKALTAPDFNIVGSTLEVTCFLDFGEFNDDGFGNFPDIYEIGLYSDNPFGGPGKFLVAYGTFAVQQKTPGNTLTNVVKVAWGRG